MYHADNYAQPPDGFIDVEPIDLTPPKRNFWQELFDIPPTSASAQMREKLEEEQCQTLFTRAALDHIGALSMQEQQMSSATPQAAARYRALIDIHTKKIIQEIERW